MKYNGESWEFVGEPGFSDAGVTETSLFVDDGVPYVAFSDWSNVGGKSMDGRVTAMKYDGQSWVRLGNAGFSFGQASCLSLSVRNGTPFVAYRDASASFKAAVRGFDGETWKPIGPNYVTTRQAEYLSLVAEQNALYLAYVDYVPNKAAVVKYTLQETASAAVDPLPTVTNEQSITVTGTAPAESEVGVFYSLDGGTETEAGTVAAGQDGRFAFELSLAGEGTYSISAATIVDGVVGTKSAPVTVLVDRTAPESPSNVTGTALDQSSVEVSWTPPSDADLAKFWIYRDDTLLRDDITSTSYVDTGLSPLTEYQYSVAAVDRAGNVSALASTSVNTGAGADVTPPTPATDLSVVYESGGLATLTWEPGTDNVRVHLYEVWRTGGEGEPEKLGEVLADQATLSYMDSGLSSLTEYKYEVITVDAARNRSIPCVEFLTTPDMTISTASLSIRPRLSPNGLLQSGTTFSFTVSGERNRTAVVDLQLKTWFDENEDKQPKPMAAQKRVFLDESQTRPGSYSGTYALPAGTSEVTAAGAKLLDPLGTETAPIVLSGLPKEVAGSIVVSLDPPVTEGFTLLAWNSANAVGASQRFEGSGPYVLNGLVAGESSLRVLSESGSMLAGGIVTVQPGDSTAATLTPAQLADVRVRVVDPAGQPVSGVRVTVFNDTLDATRPAATGITGEDGYAPIAEGFLAGETVRVAAVLQGDSQALPYVRQTEKSIEAAVGTNIVEVRLQSLPVGTLKGVTRDTGGLTLGGIVVTASAYSDGRNITVSTVSGKTDGAYELRVPAGECTVDAASGTRKYVMAAPMRVALEENQEKFLDLTLDTRGSGQIDLDMTIAYLDQPEQRISEFSMVDVLHYDIRLNGGFFGGFPVTVWGRPGDVFTVSADGGEVRLPYQSVQVTLDESRRAQAQIRLEEKSRVNLTLVDENGRPYETPDEKFLVTQVYSERSGWLSDRHSWTATISGSNCSISFKTPGSYRIEFTEKSLDPNNFSFHGRRAVIGKVEAEAGKIVDLGEIRMQSRSGLFSGSVTCVPGEAVPGSTLSLRAEFGLSPLTTPSTAIDTKVFLGVPSGTALVPGSVTLDGQPVATEVVDGSVCLSLGDVSLSPDRVSVVTYQVRLEGTFSGSEVPAKVWVQWGRETDRATDDLVQAVVPLVQVTVNVPSRLARIDPTIWGRAPVGYTVLVYDGDILLGQSRSSAAGFWFLKATLPDLGNGSIHRIQARVLDHPTGVVQSEQVEVIFDANQPELVQMTMSQQGLGTVTADPSTSVPRFPFVTVPGKPLDFSLYFSAANRVTKVRVFLGNVSAVAYWQSDGSFKASIPTPRPPYPRELGDVHVFYDVRPDVDVLSKPAPSLDEVRNRVPAELSNFEILDIGSVDQGPDAAPGSASAFVEFKPSEDSDVTARVELTLEKDVPYTPTAQDIRFVESSGVPVYGFGMSIFPSDPHTVTNTISVQVHGYIPQSLVESQGVEAAMQALMGAAMAQSRGVGLSAPLQPMAPSLDVVVKVGSKITFTTGQAWDVYDAADTIADRFGVSDQLRQLEDLLDQSTDCGSSSSQYREQIEHLATKAMIAEAAKLGLMIAGSALAPATFGFGTLAVWGITEAMEWAMDREMQQNMDDVRRQMQEDAECKRDDDSDEDDPTKPPRKPRRKIKAASPVPIWDPSGYVYEAVPENRLEGVTATALEFDSKTETWGVWDAAWFGQSNPLITDLFGKYGWDVPSGFWQVMYEKPGYQTAYSSVLEVLPPHFDVNVGMVSLAQPEVTSVVAAPDGSYVEFTFSKYMLASTFATSTVAVAPEGGTEDWILGTVSAVDAVEVGGTNLARKVRFEPAEPLTVGGKYDVWVSSAVQSYAEIPLGADFTRTITITKVSDVFGASTTAGDGKLTVTWTDPSEEIQEVRVYWRPNGAPTYNGPVSVSPGAGRCNLTGLSNGTMYEIRITTINAVGMESLGVTVTGRPVAPTPPVIPSDEPVSTGPRGTRFPVGSAGGQISGFDGRLTVGYSDGTFRDGLALYLDETQGGISAGSLLEQGLIVLTPAYWLTLSNGKPEKPVLVTFKFDPDKLGDIDPRLLGVYRQDDKDPNRWTYVGGVVDVGHGYVSVWLSGFSAYAVMARDVKFLDMDAHWARDEVKVLAAHGIAAGKGEGRFDPDAPVTRAEFAKLLVMMLMQDARRGIRFEIPQSATFADANANAWYYPYVETAALHGIVTGDTGRFRPDDPVSRQEMAAMIVRAMGLEAKASLLKDRALKFDDAKNVAPWANGYLGLVLFKGIMRGLSDTNLGPVDKATRAQAVVMIVRTMERMGEIMALEIVSGTVRQSDIEGKHYEIETLIDGKSTVWTLIPDGGMDGVIGRRLEGSVGTRVDVKGILETGPNIYMRGPVLRVVTVLLPNCPLCE